MRSQCRRRRRWNIDKLPKVKTQKEKKLEKFRSFRTSKRRKKRVSKERYKEAKKEKMLKFRNVFCVTKTPMRNKATKFAIETQEKTFS